MKLQRQMDELLSRQASGWIETLRHGDIRDRTAFVAWLKESRRHVEEFLAMVAVDRELAGIDAMREHDLQALLARIAPEAGAVRFPRTGYPEQRSHRTTRSWLQPVAVAAGILVCAMAAWFVHGNLWPWNSYSTAVGEQRTVELSDGSLVHLNTSSAIKVRFRDTARDIRLANGEALFKVAPDTGRPFKVLTQDAAVLAVGTQFNVYAREHRTTVTVLEGKVKVAAGGKVDFVSPAAMPLGAGEEADVAGNGRVSLSPTKDVETAIAWRERRLVFVDSTLEDIVAEFNRYSRAPRFRLESDSVKQRHYSGTFDADDPESLAALLSRENEIAVETTAREIIVRPAR